jgi:hypothetical protein
MVIPDRQARGCALLRRLEQIVDSVAIDLKVLESDLNACCAFRVLLDLLTPPVYRAQETRDDASVGQRLPSAHRVCLAGTGAAMRKYREVESIEEVLYSGRDWSRVSWDVANWQLCRRTLGVEQLLLRRFLLVNRAELKAERLGIVLGARYAHDGWDWFAVEGFGGDDGVLVELVFEQGAKTSNDAHTHRWYREMEEEKRKGGKQELKLQR